MNNNNKLHDDHRQVNYFNNTTDTTSSTLLGKSTAAIIRKAVRRIFSVRVLFTTLAVVAVVLAVIASGASTIVTSTRLVSELGYDLRSTLSLQAVTSLQSTIDVMKLMLGITAKLFNFSFNSLADLSLDKDLQIASLVNVLKAQVTRDVYLISLQVVLDNRNALVINSFENENTMYLYLNNQTMIVEWNGTYSYNMTFDGASYSEWFSEIFWNRTQSYPLTFTDYWTTNVFLYYGYHAFAFTGYLFDKQGRKYGTITGVYDVKVLEACLNLANPSQNSFLLITDSSGNYIASTIPDASNNSLIDIDSDYPLNATGISELSKLNKGVIRNYRGWEFLTDVFNIVYTGSENKKRIARKENITFPNVNWYMFVAWHGTEWTKQIQRNTMVNMGISLGVLIAVTAATLIVSISVGNSLNKLKRCFRRIKHMKLDSKLISKTVKSRYIMYETSELATSFKAMLSTLKSFQKYVPDYVIYRVTSLGIEATLGVQGENCSIFFLDIQDFTSLSEILKPHQLVEVISEALEVSSQAIVRNHGIIDKYIGDCVMAFWFGDNHHTNACLAALDSNKALNEMGPSWSERKLPILKCRIGINSGPVLMGNVGARHRFNYTVIGDNVNMASRVEALNKHYGTTIMITEHTKQFLNPGEFLLRRLDRVQLKGKEQITTIFELIKAESDVTKEDMQLLELYTSALTLYEAGDLEAAKEAFQAIPNYDTDPVILKKIRQCEEYSSFVNWNGVLRMEVK